MPTLGEVWQDDHYLLSNGTTGKKYLVILAVDHNWIVVRRFTTKAHGRPNVQGCHQANGMRSGFFVGVLGGALTRDTWVDLGRQEDIDPSDFGKRQAAGRYHLLQAVDSALLCSILMCAITADDTTPSQEKQMYNSRATLGCR